MSERGKSLIPTGIEVTELFYETHSNGIALYAGPRTPHLRFPGMCNNLKLATFPWDREAFVAWIVETYNGRSA